jgi:hypothetical protein
MHINAQITDKGRINLATYESKQLALENYVLDALNARTLGTVAASVVAFEGSQEEVRSVLIKKLKALKHG